MNIHEAIGV